MPQTRRYVVPAVLAVLSGVLMSCRDMPTNSPAKPQAGGEVLSAMLGCRVEVATGDTRCEPLSADGTPMGDAQYTLIPDAQWMVETMAGTWTPADSTYRMSVRVNNDTGTKFGTADGVTVTGFKVFLPANPMGYHGRPPGNTADPYGMLVPPMTNINQSAKARNHDGTGSFTRANQPYWYYPEALEPSGTSQWREWKFTLHPDVSYFYFSVGIITLSQGEQAVSATPPSGWFIPADTVNALFAHNNLLIVHPRTSGPYPRDVVLVAFAAGTTVDEKQAAVDQVNGTVVGGDGVYYFVRVTNGAEPVWTAIDKLMTLPRVEEAHPFLYSGIEGYRRPNNGTGWARADWQVHPDSARGANWAPEAIGAPGAWGCETGNAGPLVAVVDYGTEHGQLVGRIVSSPGNTGAGTTGMMWTSNLLVTDASQGGTATGLQREANIHADLRTAFQQGARVINLSVDLGYTDAAGNPRLPVVGDTADINHARRYAERKRRYLLELEAQFPAVRPLYVIGAGNYQVNASYSGWPQLGTTGALASRVIVVAAHDSVRTGQHRAMWANDTTDALRPGSNTGAHVAAPGVNLQVRMGTMVYTVRGTSYATPHVTGLAGLLLSQRASLTAEELRTLIVEGATRGSRSAGTHPIINAYESLRRASERTGWPLCGNRVWAQAGQIYARRGSATEALGPAESSNAPYEVEPLHGGKHVTYNTTAGRRTLAWQTNGTWQLGSLPGDWLQRLGGTTSSLFGSSHDNDSTVSVNANTVNDNEWWRTADQMEVPVMRGATELGRLTINDLPEPTKEICLERVEFDPNDPSHPICTLTYNTSRWWIFRLAYPQAYQPVLVTVSPIKTVLTDSTAWRTCTHDATLECRNVRSDRLEAGTKVYRLPLTGGRPQLVDDLTGGPVFWIGHTEVVGRPAASDTVVLGRGRWIVERWFDPDRYWQFGDGYTMVRGLIEDCGIEYRALTGFTVGQRIETSNVCNLDYLDFPTYAGGGTIAPYRRGESGMFSAQPAPGPMRRPVRLNAAFAAGKR